MKTSNAPNQNIGHPVFRFFKEIMSVTIGLSLALGIENYSSLTQNRNLESYYLTEIKNDLRTDNDKIKEIINNKNRNNINVINIKILLLQR